MPDFDVNGKDAVETPVPRGNPRDRNPVAPADRYAQNRYGQPEVGSDLSSSAENPTPPASPSDRSEPVDRVEMQRLREMLREQQQATLRAMHTAADLQNKLASA